MGTMQYPNPVGGQTEKRGMKLSDWIFIGICVFLIAAVVFFRFWWRKQYFGVIVNGSSMNQTLQHEDELFVRSMKDGVQAKRGDVIVVYTGAYSQTGNGSYLIKRLIAIEGDKVRCKDGQIEICYAGTQEYVALYEPYAYYGDYKEEYDFAEYQVQAGEIFFLGDNRSSSGSSQDSRYKEGHSNLECLYKQADIYGVVPSWSMEYKSICKFFIRYSNVNMQ